LEISRVFRRVVVAAASVGIVGAFSFAGVRRCKHAKSSPDRRLDKLLHVTADDTIISCVSFLLVDHSISSIRSSSDGGSRGGLLL
jgi:hypothetical protein